MSAVIYAAIVVMWAVVLVPMWLRRHDAATESRSVDRFSTAMRILSRRSAGGPDRRYVLMPRREESMSVHVSGAAAVDRRPRPGRPTAPARPARANRPTVATTSIVVRRRRMLLGLLGLAGFTFLLAATGVISWPLQLVVDVVLAAFVTHLRAQARRAVAVSRQRRRATVAPARPPAPATPTAPVAAPPVGASTPAAATTAAAVAEHRGEAATGTEDVFATWQPIPVPPPTYTLKPPAPSLPVEAPGAAQVDGDVPFDQEAVPAQSAGPDGGQLTDLDDILEHRWAVND